MRLKYKLALAFTFMLLLMAVLSFLGWQGVETMARRANFVAVAQNALDSLLTSQGQRLEYQMLPSEATYRSAQKQIADGLLLLNKAEALAETPEQRATLTRITQALHTYSGHFAQLGKDVDATLDGHNALSSLGADLVQQLNALIGQLENENSSRLRPTLVLLGETQLYFYRARMEVTDTVRKPTPEQVSATLKTLEATADRIKLVQNALSHYGEYPVAGQIVTGMDLFTRRFQSLTDATLLLQNKNASMQQALMDNISAMRQLAEHVEQGISQNMESVRLRMFGMAFLAIILAVATALYLNRNVHNELGRDPHTLARLAQRVTDGDFAIDDGRPRKGVYGNLLLMVEALRRHIDKAQSESEHARQESDKAKDARLNAEKAVQEASLKAEAMQQAATRLEEVASVLTAASTQLGTQITQSESGAAHQSQRVQATVSAMTEMNATVQDVACNAGAASETSAKARQQAEEGAGVVRQVVSSIQRVQHQSQMLKEDMVVLDQNAQAISQIMSVISDIADQTNLLALNAAIEAARAGDAGRGFAVVADEVRKLAEKTMQSTTDVGSAIKAIQDSAEKSRGQMDEAVSTIEEATSLASRSGEALTEIVKMVDSTAEQVRAIATAAEEQSASSEEINRSIREVSSIAEETLRTMHEASGAVTDLGGQAQNLSRLIDHLKNN